MSGLDDLKKANESKFQHDADLAFKIEARRNKLLGLWVAEKLGLAGDEAAAYAKEVVGADLAEAGEEDVIRKILADVQARNVDLSEHRIRAKMAELAPIARQLLRERVGFGELRDKARRTTALLGRAALNAPELVLELEKIVRSGRLPISLDRRDLQLLASGSRQRPLAGHLVISAALIIAAAILFEGQPTLAGTCAFASAIIIAVEWFRRK